MWANWFKRKAKEPPQPVDPAKCIRKHFLFSGRVQGVGFRYEVMLLAEEYNLTGWIRNNPDGTVEGELQGCAEYIALVVPSLKSIQRIRIRSVEERSIPVKPDETDFRPIY